MTGMILACVYQAWSDAVCALALGAAVGAGIGGGDNVWSSMSPEHEPAVLH